MKNILILFISFICLTANTQEIQLFDRSNNSYEFITLDDLKEQLKDNTPTPTPPIVEEDAIYVNNTAEWIAAIEKANKDKEATIIVGDIFIDAVAPVVNDHRLHGAYKSKVLKYSKTLNQIKIPPFKGVKKLVIKGLDGKGKITTKGDFKRLKYGHKINGNPQPWYSGIFGVSPLVLKDCENVTIKDLELNGNTHLTEREGKILEGPTHGISIFGSHNVNIDNVSIHNFASDGLMIEGNIYSLRFSENIKVSNSKFYNNYRNNLTLGGVKRIGFNTVDFYRDREIKGYVPNCNMDLEPLKYDNNFVKNQAKKLNITLSPREVKQYFYTFDATFNNCKFLNAPNTNVVGYRSNRVYYNNCFFQTVKSGGHTQGMRDYGNYSEYNNCTLELRNGTHFYPTASNSDSETYIKNMTINTNGGGISAINNNKDSKLVIDGLIINYKGDKAPKLINVNHKNSKITNVKINRLKQ